MRFKTFLMAVLFAAAASFVVHKATLRSASQQYEDRISSLRAEVQLKDRRIVELENKLNPPKPVSVKSVIQVPGVSPSGLQQALRRTGLYSGPVDGRLTQKVTEAVKEFQRQKGLFPDGIVGKKTWQLLKEDKTF